MTQDVDVPILEDVFYIHFKETRRFDDPLKAARFVKICRKVAERLAGHFPVYIRKTPEFYPDNELNSTVSGWEAVARYSIADTGEPGLYFFSTNKWQREGL